MKKQSKIILLSIFFSLILIVLIVRYIHNSTFVEKNMIEYTDIKNPYIITGEYYDNHQSFIEVIISIYDKKQLIEKFQFEKNLDKLQGKIQPYFISEKNDFIYYVIKRGERSYRYILIALEENGNILQVYEMYGD